MNPILIAVLSAGVLACLAMDAWQQTLKRLAGIPPSNWAVVGRWFVLSWRKKTMYQPTIDGEAPIAHELALGWVVHYGVSVLYSVVYAVLMETSGLQANWTDGFLFGAVSVIVPWFYFMPCMGKGIMGKLTPNPTKACLVSLSNHVVYGTAMGLAFMWCLT